MRRHECVLNHAFMIGAGTMEKVAGEDAVPMAAAISLSSLRKQGPITTGTRCLTRWGHSLRKTISCGYGSRIALAGRSLVRDDNGICRHDFEQPKAFSRHVCARVLPISVSLSEERAQGKPGANRTRSLGGNKNKPTSKSTTSSASHTGFPRAMV